jgi:hypothetical protein
VALDGDALDLRVRADDGRDARRSLYDRFSMIALLVLKYTMSSSSIVLPLNTTSCLSLQPKFLTEPGSSGQLSARSTTVSPSRSVSGQPPLSGTPTSSGQRSLASITVSPSLSGSGQPSSSSKSSRSSACSGQASVGSDRPSPSLSGTVSAQPSPSWKPFLVSRPSGH